VHLKPLAYCLPVEDDFALYRGAAAEGVLRVRAAPCRPDGAPLLEDDAATPYDDVEDPKDLVGRRLDVLVSVIYARGVNGRCGSRSVGGCVARTMEREAGTNGSDLQQLAAGDVRNAVRMWGDCISIANYYIYLWQGAGRWRGDWGGQVDCTPGWPRYLEIVVVLPTA
jgi:hypothetical protein